MCRLRCYVEDYGEEKTLGLVHYRRAHQGEKAVGAEEKFCQRRIEETVSWDTRQ